MNYYNYFTEREEHFVRKRGKHLLLSPLDWNLIAAWRDAGVPLSVAIRGIDIAVDKFYARGDKSRSKLNTLCYCHDSVMAEYASHIESHVGESPAESSAQDDLDPAEITGYLSRIMDEIRVFSEKHNRQEGIARVLARLDEILHNIETADHIDSETLERDLAIVDDLLVAELKSAVAGEQMDELEKEARKDLKVYKKRLPKETYEKIRDNFLREKLHRLFGIGELSIIRL